MPNVSLKNRWRLLSLLLLLMIPSTYADSVKLVAFQYPPLVYLEDDQVADSPVKGHATALVRALFAQMGLTIEIEILPWPRALQYMQHGQADAVFTIFKNAEREHYLHYTEQFLIEQEITLYARKDTPITITDPLQDLIPLRVGATRAVSYGRRFDATLNKKLKNVILVNDEEAKFLLLDRRRVDVVVSNNGIADYYLKKLGLEDRIVRLPVVIERVPSYLAFSRASPKSSLVPAFEAALKTLRESGRYAQILEQAAAR